MCEVVVCTRQARWAVVFSTSSRTHHYCDWHAKGRNGWRWHPDAIRSVSEL